MQNKRQCALLYMLYAAVEKQRSDESYLFLKENDFDRLEEAFCVKIKFYSIGMFLMVSSGKINLEALLEDLHKKFY